MGTDPVRRATIIMASASGTPVSAIARLVAAGEDTVRDVVHALASRLAAPDPQWAGGRPRLTSDEDIEEVTSRFAFDQVGPLSIRPCHGGTRAVESKPTR